MTSRGSLADAAVARRVALAGFLDVVPVPAALLDAAGTILGVNDPWRRLVASAGFAGAGFEVGARWLDVCDGACPSADADGVALSVRLAELLRGERAELDVDYRLDGAGGARWYRLVGRPLAEMDGAVVMHVDVTAQRRLEDETRRARAEVERRVRERTADLSRANVLLQYEIGERQRAWTERNRLLDEVRLERKLLVAVLEQMPLGVMIAEAPSGRVLLHNQQLTKLVGGPLAAVGAAPDGGRALHPDGRPYAADEYPLARALRGEAVDAEEIEYERAGGRRVILRGSAVPVRDGPGRIIASVVAYYDVTEWREAERQLRASEMRYRLASRAINDAIWDWDVPGSRIEWSDGVHLRFGHPPSTVGPGLEWWLEQVHPLDRTRVRLGIEGALAGTSENWRDEYRFRCFDGRYAHVVDRGFIVRDAHGRAIRAVGAMQDVTERHRAEAERAALLERERRARAEAEEANRAKDEFLAVVSHELRTPLAPILGFVDILREDDVDSAEARAALNAIDRNARSLSVLIDDLLDVARITSGKLALEYAPVHLREVVAAVVDAVGPVAETKGVRIETVLGAAHDLVAGDTGRLTQIVSNLLSNAVKFTPEGGRVRVAVAREADHAVLRVADTGKGIAAELLPHVFERFRQGDTSDTRVHGGLGLGLAIVRHLVELHGGTVVAESPGEGKGATFTVRLPLMPPARSSR
ncbi:MAG: ATP-binding protein [Thermodesulfobacteriota bacterium]